MSIALLKQISKLTINDKNDELEIFREKIRLMSAIIEKLQTLRDTHVRMIEDRERQEERLHGRIDQQEQLIAVLERLVSQKEQIEGELNRIIKRKSSIIQNLNENVAKLKDELHIVSTVLEHYKQKDQQAKETMAELSQMNCCKDEKCCAAIRAGVFVFHKEPRETQEVKKF